MPNADDRAEIVQATYLYARGLDRFDPKEALSAYTDDAVWDATGVGLERYEGRDQVLAFFERDAGSMSEQFHIMTNHVVEFEEGRRIAWQPRPTSRLAGLAIGGRIWRYELTPVGGGTLVRETWDIRSERFPLPLLAGRAMARKAMTRSLERLEERLAQ